LPSIAIVVSRELFMAANRPVCDRDDRLFRHEQSTGDRAPVATFAGRLHDPDLRDEGRAEGLLGNAFLVEVRT